MKWECLLLNKAIEIIIGSEAGRKDENQWDMKMRSIQGRQNSMLLLNRCSLSVIIVNTHSVYPCRSKKKKKVNNNKKTNYISFPTTVLVKCENLSEGKNTS